MAPLFDHNMAYLPLMMEGDDLDAYLNTVGPKIGTDYVAIARALMAPSSRSKLVALRDFEHTDPGLGCPTWWAEMANRLTGRTIARVLD